MTTGDYVWRWTYDLFYPLKKIAYARPATSSRSA